ncbi:ArsR/SmtB family transcription factor [Candidatus Stoquefichus sp. SB1]|jgi:DNA-binding transcriptional ArsR family regulator|uniref:ArsR/SmtB family transcription factor n=1 Tax=Candidatus Stoquefichus sp. SB1 TaxID=1658109 RepID=UPI00067E67D9|nr:metalloregulator ArsR/SmtB family transcription factor [Candidatus Stoquefichus sp. SB1]
MKDDCQQRIEKITQGFQDCQKVLTAIGDETRQVIILVLLQSDLSGKRVGQIAKEAHLSRPSVSHHLQILKEAGIVNMNRVGTRNYYYMSGNEERWKEIVDLVELVYESVLHIKK